MSAKLPRAAVFFVSAEPYGFTQTAQAHSRLSGGKTSDISIARLSLIPL